jgi:hypothetical protein
MNIAAAWRKPMIVVKHLPCPSATGVPHVLPSIQS